jgi:hypothetical protein
VDVVLEDGSGELAAVEVKAGSTVSARDFTAMRALASDVGRRFRRGVLLYTGQSTIPLGPHLQALPISALWEWGARQG